MGLLGKISLYVLFVLSATNTRGIIIQGAVPKSLWGKKVVLNGPQINVEKNFIEGPGHITSVNLLDHGKVVVSQVLIPDNPKSFRVSDFFKTNFFELICKSFKTKLSYINTDCSTSVQKYNGKYYALEDTSIPAELKYNKKGEIQFYKINKYMDIMSPHLIDKTTNFRYINSMISYYKAPLKYNNTEIHWKTRDHPVFIHTGRITPRKEFLIFPISSTRFDYLPWIEGKKDLPLKSDSATFNWLLYNLKTKEINEIDTGRHVNILHIPKIVDSYDDKIKIYSPHIDNFFEWITKTGELGLSLHEHTIDLKNKKMISIRNLGLQIEFVNSQDCELVGKECGDSNDILVYNILNCNTERITLPGGTIREVIPYGNSFVYYSHEKTNTYLYIVDKRTIEILTKIEVPNREPGFHTTLLD